MLMRTSTSACKMMFMGTPDGEHTALPAFAAVGILTLFVLLSISGYLILSAR